MKHRDQEFRNQPTLFDAPPAATPTTRIARPVVDQGRAHSREVHQRIAPRLPSDRQAVLDVIRNAGTRGATLFELSEALRKQPHEISGRITELVQAGLVIRPGHKRKSPAGRTYLVAFDWTVLSQLPEVSR